MDSVCEGDDISISVQIRQRHRCAQAVGVAALPQAVWWPVPVGPVGSSLRGRAAAEPSKGDAN